VCTSQLFGNSPFFTITVNKNNVVDLLELPEEDVRKHKP